MSTNVELHKVIDSWHKRASQVQDAHYDSGSLCKKWFNILGLSVVILSALLGSCMLRPEPITHFGIIRS